MTTTTTSDQPDGIPGDSHALPTPGQAARRVNDFLAWYGDGLVYAETGAPPLFARDLQALANVVTREGEKVDAPTVRDFCAERAGFITAIRNCHPDNVSDYHRWQGNAEARRQLSERLGLPTAWPAGGA